MTSILECVALGGAVMLGAAVQRMTGVGFALVASPFLVLLLGSLDGVLVVNIFGALTALLVFVRSYRQVEYRRIMPILAMAILVAIPSALVVHLLSAASLSILVGALILIALAGSALARKFRPVSGGPAALIAGAISGFMNVTAGAGGPALTAFAMASRWDPRKFAVSVQPYFFFLGVTSLLAKHSWPELSWQGWLSAGGGLLIGLALGWALHRVVAARVGFAIAVGFAAVGAGTLVVSGALRLA